MGRTITVGGRTLSRPFFIAGPCVIESREICLEVADTLAGIAERESVPIIFKASFDKANRTSIDSFRGPGLQEGLRILEEVGQATGLPLISDIHTPDQAEPAAQVLDIIQIPAFLSRQTDLLLAAARTGLPLNIKKAQFMAPEDMAQVAAKVKSLGHGEIMLTERGTSFGYRNLVVDMRSLLIMSELGHPVVFDATHSVQRPGGLGLSSGGDRAFAGPLAKAAMAVGADGVFMEVHPEPEAARCDGPNSIPLSRAAGLIDDLIRIAEVTG